MKTDNSEIRSILARIKNGEEQAFRELYELYSPLVNSKVKEFSPSLEADEIRQISSIGLFDAAVSYEEERANGAVTFGFYAGVCINNRLTSEMRRIRPSYELTDANTADTVHSPEEAIIAREDISAKLDAVEALLTPYEAKVLKFYLTGKSYRETAAILGKSEKSVDNALSRIRAKVRDK